MVVVAEVVQMLEMGWLAVLAEEEELQMHREMVALAILLL